MTLARIIVSSLLALALPTQAPAQSNEAGVYVIFDASGSMWGKLPSGKRKIVAARKALNDFFADGMNDRPVALRAYGHRRKGDCADTQLIQEFSSDPEAIAKIQRFVKAVNPRGKTPISRSLKAALKDFSDRPGEIILISDGIETCDADPCALVKEWANKEIAIKVHVVGLGLSKKESSAMQCIANAAGTKFIDAQSTGELTAGLGNIKEQVIGNGFNLVATVQGGTRVKANGYLIASDGKKITVSTHSRYVIDAGRYQLTTGVPTRNGSLYRPISKSVLIKARGTTRVAVVLPMPPRVSVSYTDNGKTVQPSGTVSAYQEGVKVFSFRAKDEVYVDEGSYEFRAQPNKFNNLVRLESLGSNDRKVLEFELVHSVRLKVHFLSSATKVRYRGSSPELWQKGKSQFKINGNSGGWVIPGDYNVIFSSGLTGKLVKAITVSDQAKQTVEILVPSGQKIFQYEKPDGTRAKDKRLFVSRADDSKSRQYVSAGKKTNMPVGKYSLTGFQPPNGFTYPRTDFSVSEGGDETIVIRPVPIK